MDLHGANRRVLNRLGGPSATPTPDSSKNQKVCYNWRAGKCRCLPCPFLHRELPHPSSAAANGPGASKRFADDSGFSGPAPRRGPNFNGNHNNSWRRMGANKVVRKTEKVCDYWVQGNCNYGDRCKFLHSWSLGESFTLLNHLDGHQKVVTGIALPEGMDKLYTGSKDETVRAWDTNTGQKCPCEKSDNLKATIYVSMESPNAKYPRDHAEYQLFHYVVEVCMDVLNLGGEVGCMISEGPWLFVSIPNVVKAWNTQTNQELSLSGTCWASLCYGCGYVYIIMFLVLGSAKSFCDNNLLIEAIFFLDGTILVWKFDTVTNSFEPAASLKGHTRAVVSLVVGANRLYSGSVDHSIKAWSLETLQCLQTLTEQTDVVMSLLCWEQFLLSCSLDQTINVWVATENGNLEVTYTHSEQHGLLNLRGMYDSESKPVLVCACNDSSVRLYDLPSVKSFAEQEIRAIEVGPGGLFFTGDGTGFRVWKWGEPFPKP
ncbi:hypothetical protein V6N13_135508 [Hibiscus sabdariffa]|uniref:C3H1-type domain-containing protein n=1 Tax=Hibiscus sabdariffa TaxID=183260 RepID=A0ABR2R7L5_9ROSI